MPARRSGSEPEHEPCGGAGAARWPAHRNHFWTYDFVMDRTAEGRSFRMLTIVDEFTRECLAVVFRYLTDPAAAAAAFLGIRHDRGVPLGVTFTPGSRTTRLTRPPPPPSNRD